jgi:ABC-type transporter Mla subunit MlaD
MNTYSYSRQKVVGATKDIDWDFLAHDFKDFDKDVNTALKELHEAIQSENSKALKEALQEFKNLSDTLHDALMQADAL